MERIKIHKKILGLTIAVLLLLGFVIPTNGIVHASNEIIGENEAATYTIIANSSEDKQSVDVILNLEAKKNVTLQSIILPDGSVQEYKNKPVTFTALENGAIAFSLKYTINEVQVKEVVIEFTVDGIESNKHETKSAGPVAEKATTTVSTSDGLTYTLNAEDNTAVLTSGPNAVNVIIPATVSDNGKVYTVNEIEKNAFYDKKSLRTLTLPNTLKKINDFAFMYCSNLEDFILPEGLEEIGNYAFYGCNSITSVTLPSSIRFYGKESFSDCRNLRTFNFPNDMSDIPLSYQSFWNDNTVATNYDIYHNFKKWFKGSTVLPAIENSPLPTPDLTGWESKQQGTNQGDSLLFKSARYTNEEKTEAEIRFDLSYSAKLSNAHDIIFVLDDTTSMYDQASPKGSRLFTMLSKVADVSEAFLKTDQYDNRVAFVSFGLAVNASLDFTDNWPTVDSFLYNEMGKGGETNYSIGFEKAKELIDNRSDKSREPLVIFLSDGEVMPALPGMPDFSGVNEAKAIMDENIPIYGIAMDMDTSDSIKNVSTQAFSSNSPDEFNDALNTIISNLLTKYLLVDVISNDFELNGNELTAISVTGGNVTYEKGKLSWDLHGTKPATNYTLIIKIKQKAENGVFPFGSIETNAGEAILSNDTQKINGVESPIINRGDAVKVIYEPDTATQGKCPEDNTAYGIGSTVNIMAPDSLKKDGYLFAGWSTIKGDNKVEYIIGNSFIIMANTTLYPVWKIDIDHLFTVNYEFVSTKHPNGVNVPQNVTVKYGTTTAEPKFTAMTDWTFDGWYLDKECTQKFDFETAIKMDITLFGKWSYKAEITEPVKPSQPDKPSTNDKSVDTGDTINSMAYGIAMMVSLLGLIILVMKKQERKKINK